MTVKKKNVQSVAKSLKAKSVNVGVDASNILRIMTARFKFPDLQPRVSLTGSDNVRKSTKVQTVFWMMRQPG